VPITLERKIAGGFAAAVGFMLVVGGAAWWSAKRSAQTFQWVDHTHEVLYQLEATLVDMLNMQTATRGYLLTNQERFLEPYESGSARIAGNFQKLHELTKDNPAQLERLHRLEADMNRLLEIMRERVALNRAGSLSAARDVDDLEAGNTAITEVREVIAEMEQAERALLAERSAAAQRGQQRAVLVFGFGSLTGVALVVLAGLLVRRGFLERAKAEEERDRFFSLSLDLLCISSVDGYFKRVSPAVTDILGWTPAEFTAQPYIDLVHPEDRPATLEEVRRQVERGEKVLHFENRYRHKDGSWRVLSWRSVPQPAGLMYAIARDVTAQKAIDAALQASELEYRTLFDSIDEGYCILELIFDGQDRPVDFRFTKINPAFERLTGLAGAADRRIRELSPDFEDHWFETYGRIARTGEPERFQNYAAPLQRWFDIYAFRYGDAANRQVAVLFRNITDQKAQENEIRQLNAGLEQRAALLEATNKELEAFSYSVSHDLRAPLRHIDGFASLLQKSAGPTLSAQGQRHLATISAAARQMGRLIDDLLSFSRMGRAQLQLQPVEDHDALVAAVIRDGRWDRPVDWQIAPLPPVRADRAMLQQVWVNLIDNAVKYSGKVAAPRIEIGSRTDPAAGETVFFIRDNGAGFDMRYAGKLFGVFQRLHGPGEFEGTGIGLANIRRIILRHGGRTWAEGEIGRGATFHFSLPTASTPAAL